MTIEYASNESNKTTSTTYLFSVDKDPIFTISGLGAHPKKGREIYMNYPLTDHKGSMPMLKVELIVW